MNISVNLDLYKLSDILNSFCLDNLDDPRCISIKLEGEMTLDDVDYVMDIPLNQTTTAIVGSYIPTVFTVAGIIGNMASLCISAKQRKTEEVYVYVDFLAMVNLMYLCTASISQEVRAAGIIALTHRHYLACMLWPYVVELLSNTCSWSVVLLSLHHLRSKKQMTTDSDLFLAKVKCLLLLLVMVFLNFHTTILRELDNNECTISAKAGLFYRDIWPWIRMSCGTYMPWVVAVVAMVKQSISQRRNCSMRKMTVLCWCYIIPAALRIALLPYQYHLMRSKKTDTSQQMTILYLQLARELCATAMHSLAFVPILLITRGAANATPTHHSTSQECQIERRQLCNK